MTNKDTLQIGDMNLFAATVAEREGGKKNLSIAQIKEVIKHTVDILNESATAESTWRSYKNTRRRSVKAMGK